eukprot:6174029-Pleurochrysis_carterae.AAC.6
MQSDLLATNIWNGFGIPYKVTQHSQEGSVEVSMIAFKAGEAFFKCSKSVPAQAATSLDCIENKNFKNGDLRTTMMKLNDMTSG